MIQKNKWRWFTIIVIIMPILAFGLVRWYETRIESLPYYGKNYQTTAKEDALTVPSFSFINQDGNLTTQEFVSGKSWVACYFFTTCPTICPLMISGMQDIQEVFGNSKELKMISFTVDPDHDTPGVLRDYAFNRSINTNQWSLVTGNKVDLYRFARKELMLVATDGDGGPADFIHSDRLVLIDKENHIRGYYDGTETADINQLKRDINKLLETK